MNAMLDNPRQLIVIYGYWARFHAWVFLAPWGGWLAGMQSYESSSTYDVMASVAPEIVLGGFFLASGIMLGAIVRARRERLMAITFGLSVCTAIIFLFFLVGNPRSTGTLTYGVMVVADLLALGHLYALKWPLAARAALGVQHGN